MESLNGIPEAEAPLEMARRLGLNLSVKQRILFSEKAKSIRIGTVPSPQKGDILLLLESHLVSSL